MAQPTCGANTGRGSGPRQEPKPREGVCGVCGWGVCGAVVCAQTRVSNARNGETSAKRVRVQPTKVWNGRQRGMK